LAWSDCAHLPPLAPGEARAMTFTATALGDRGAEFSVSAEGADLQSADNAARFAFGPTQAFDVWAAPAQRLKDGIKLTVVGAQAQRARMAVAFKVRGRTVKLGRVVKLGALTSREVTIRAGGAKLRSLRRALAKGPLSAEITVRTFSGKTPVTVKTKVSG
jgi:hypothetical protein